MSYSPFQAPKLAIDGIASTIVCPGKDVNEIRQEAEKFELSFLFYHASWNDDSRTALKVYDQIAVDYQKHIYFATIDCYHLACNCSKTHSFSLGSGAPNKWPTLIVHYGHRIPVQYNGEWNVKSLHRFIENLFYPVERVQTKEELKKLNMERDAVVLGAFDFESQLEYRKFVSAGVKWLEIDPKGSFRFAAVFGKAADLGLNEVNNTNEKSQLLFISNKGMNEPPIKWNVSNIVLWLKNEFVRSVSNLYEYNSPKSIPVLLRSSPVLILVGSDYFYEYMKTLTNPEISANKLCSTQYLNQDIAQHHDLEYVKETLEKIDLLNPNSCYEKEFISHWNLRYYYSLNSFLTRFIHNITHNPNHEINSELMIEKLKSCFRNDQFDSPSRKMLAAKYLKNFVDNNWLDFKSEQNVSLSVVLLDEDKHFDFLQSLGVKSTSAHKSVTMIIADKMQESIFLSQTAFTYEALKHFVRSYYNNNLTAYTTASKLKIYSQLTQNKIFIENINSEFFLKKIERSNLTTIVLLYSPHCMFSTLFSQSLVQLAALLDDSSGIQIIRINTLYDELPWAFKIENTPTLIVFPRSRPADTRIFPRHLKSDVRNIFSFTLAQMEPVEQLKALLSFCRSRKLYSQGMRKCLQYIRTLADQHISGDIYLQQLVKNRFADEQMSEWREVDLEIKKILPIF
ncbi:unnamed protein product [Ceratitis capitata]|uniref:(Mediterranean fruit fly) hypothetical protein n=1 Tax=Ceratitis capitata TaxID=7213 RepID=A0A811UXM5_CERCA|nr:unnamed protein product [Ceratitis capitata]